MGYSITDQTTHTRIVLTGGAGEDKFWAFPKVGTTYNVTNGVLSIYSRGHQPLDIRRALITTPASISDITLGTALEFMMVAPSAGGGIATVSNGLTAIGSEAKLGGANALTANTVINVATFSLGIGLASMTATTFTAGALEAVAAGVVIGGSSLAASSIFDVNSTTKGSRPIPRMTKAERLAIATPAAWSKVIQTDGLWKGDWTFDGVYWIPNERKEIVEHFKGTSPAGEILSMLTNVAAGGAVGAALNAFSINQGGLTTYPRFGLVTFTLPAAVASRAKFYRAGATSGVIVALNAAFWVAEESLQSDIWDSTLEGAKQYFGYFPLTQWAAAFGNADPALGFAIRAPYTNEAAQTWKAVVIVGSVEVAIIDTTVVWNVAGGYIEKEILWDGSENTMYFTVANQVNRQTVSIATFLTTYPTFASANLQYGYWNSRPGILSTGSHGGATDLLREWTFDVPFF